jgi:hypothetical protein
VGKTRLSSAIVGAVATLASLVTVLQYADVSAQDISPNSSPQNITIAGLALLVLLLTAVIVMLLRRQRPSNPLSSRPTRGNHVPSSNVPQLMTAPVPRIEEVVETHTSVLNVVSRTTTRKVVRFVTSIVLFAGLGGVLALAYVAVSRPQTGSDVPTPTLQASPPVSTPEASATLPVVFELDADLDGLLVAKPDAEAALIMAVEPKLARFDQCVAAVVLTSVNASDIATGNQAADTVNATLLESFPNVFRRARLTGFAILDSQDLSTVRITIYFLLPCE